MSSARRLVFIVSAKKNTGTMVVGQVLVLLASAMVVSGQRPSFAGTRPIGFPELLNKTTTTPSGLVDKFGEVTTQRLPIEAQGDRELVDRLSKLPLDKQPFWFINWQALEADRQKPQTYPLKPNQFLESNFQNTNSVPQIPNTNPTGNPNPGVTNSNPVPSAIPGNLNPGSGVQSPNVPNTKDQGQLNIKNGNSNEDKTQTEASIPGVTSSTSASIETSNATVDNVNKPKPGLVKEGNPEKNEFADIDVKKLGRKN